MYKGIRAIDFVDLSLYIKCIILLSASYLKKLKQKNTPSLITDKQVKKFIRFSDTGLIETEGININEGFDNIFLSAKGECWISIGYSDS